VRFDRPEAVSPPDGLANRIIHSLAVSGPRPFLSMTNADDRRRQF
jgi:hypothetical protein